jgi:ENTS family enterobactin (siderophore) exporter
MAAVPALVRRELVPAAAALHQVLTQVGQVAGPAAAGLIVARASFATAYTVDFATFTAAGLLALALRRLPPGESGTRAGVASV